MVGYLWEIAHYVSRDPLPVSWPLDKNPMTVCMVVLFSARLFVQPRAHRNRRRRSVRLEIDCFILSVSAHAYIHTAGFQQIGVQCQTACCALYSSTGVYFSKYVRPNYVLGRGFF